MRRRCCVGFSLRKLPLVRRRHLRSGSFSTQTRRSDRSALIEKEVQPGVPVAPANLTLFGDLPAANQITVDLNAAGENCNQRHRVIELTVPLRNILMQS